ncbi:hypothetical protein [Sessilibacter sp. MAH4]
MKIHKDEIGIITIYTCLTVYFFWLFFTLNRFNSSGEEQLVGHLLISYELFPLATLVAGVTTLILGWSGLVKPKYKNKLLIRQYIIYWAGVMPAIIFAACILVYVIYIYRAASI